MAQCGALLLAAASLFVLPLLAPAQADAPWGRKIKDAFPSPGRGTVSPQGAGTAPAGAASAPIVVDHACTDLRKIPQQWIQTAKANLHIAYGHTSHGSQLTTGMTGLVAFVNGGGLGLSYPQDFFAWNHGGAGGALDLHDYAMEGDCGYHPDWVRNTRAYLGPPDPATGRGTTHPSTNVILWSWCGQVDDKFQAGALYDEYLGPMAELENEYPGVLFVYMTGHVDHWDDAANKAANHAVRDFCRGNNKILYDFADIESYDPDGTFYAFPHDDCHYYASADSGSPLGNWAAAWQASHTEGVDWYLCDSAHSEPLNANRKAYAAWWLWARLAGWDGSSGVSCVVSGRVTWNGMGLANVVMEGFPGNEVRTGADGAYAVRVDAGWTGTVRPARKGYRFTPAQRAYSSVAADQPGQHFAARRIGASFLPLLLLDRQSGAPPPLASRPPILFRQAGRGLCPSPGIRQIVIGAETAMQPSPFSPDSCVHGNDGAGVFPTVSGCRRMARHSFDNGTVCDEKNAMGPFRSIVRCLFLDPRKRRFPGTPPGHASRHGDPREMDAGV